MKQIFLTLCMSLLAMSLFGQEYSIIDRRAIKLYEQAEELSQERKYEEAIEKYRASFERSSDFFEAYIKMSQILLTQGDYVQALEVAQKGERRVKKDPSFLADFGWLIVNIHLRSGAFEKALDKMDEISPLLTLDFKKTAYYQEIKEQIDFLTEAFENPKEIKKERLSHPLNQFQLQYFPVLTADSKKILFTKRD